MTAAAASGGDVQAAANAAASGASTGAVAATAASTNLTIAASTSAVAAAASTGASAGATAGVVVAAAAAGNDVTVDPVALATASAEAAVVAVTEAASAVVVVETETAPSVIETVEPPDPVTIATTTFTIQLSYGTVLVSIEERSDSDNPTFTVTPGGTGGTVFSSNGGAIQDLILPNVGTASGGTRALSADELNQIGDQILTLQGAVVVVPGNPIFVSPSS